MINIEQQKGFSLVELLVAVSIMIIMTVAITPRYLSYKTARSMMLAKTQIVNDVRYVQDSTLSGMKFPGSSPAAPPRGGYGIRFSTATPNSYIIFGDLGANPDQQYNGTGEMVETVSLPSGVTITGLSINSGGNVDYICTPPYGKGFVNGTQGVSLTITLRNADAATSTVVISSSGNVIN